MEDTYGKKNLDLFNLIKAIIISIIIALILIIIGAFIIKIFNIGDDYVSIINYIIKVVSVFFAVLISLRGTTFGWFKGIIVGCAFAVLAYLIFSMLQAKFSLGISVLSDLIVCGISGALSGIIASCLKNN